jgi:hypothetical protein
VELATKWRVALRVVLDVVLEERAGVKCTGYRRVHGVEGERSNDARKFESATDQPTGPTGVWESSGTVTIMGG